MYTWNTITLVNSNKLEKAIFFLEILRDMHNVPILNLLTENGPTTFLDLIVQTHYDSNTLEDCLEELCQTGVVQLSKSLLSCKYFVDKKRLNHILSLTKKLSNGRLLVD